MSEIELLINYVINNIIPILVGLAVPGLVFAIIVVVKERKERAELEKLLNRKHRK